MIQCKTLPHLLKQQPFWLLANKKKIPVLPQSDIHITGERIDHCQSWDNIRPLIERNIHPYAVYLHNDQEPYISLDLDHARNVENGEPEDWVKPLFEALGITEEIWMEGNCKHATAPPFTDCTIGQVAYKERPCVEISASGTGYHVLFTGKTSFGKRSWFTTEKRGKNAPKIEVISCNSPVTWTGHLLPGSGQKALPIELLLGYVTTKYPEQHEDIDDLSNKCSPFRNNQIPNWRSRNDTDINAADIADMLDRLNPDCGHDEWKQIGMAIHDWDSSHTGKNLWIQWSQGGEKFNNEAKKTMDSAWKGFKSGKGIGLGTLIKKALDAGYQFPERHCSDKKKVSTTTEKVAAYEVNPQKNHKEKKCKNTEEVSRQTSVTEQKETAEVVPISKDVGVITEIRQGINALIEQYNQRFVHTLVQSKNVVMYQRKSNLHPTQNEWVPMPIHEFRQMLCHEPTLLTGFNARNEPVYKKPAAIWLDHPKARWCEHCIFKPEPMPWVNGCLNLYQGFAITPQTCTWEDPDVRLWLNHLNHIICRDNQEQENYVLNWLAHMIQLPEQKPKTSIILKGKQGTGKGSFMDPIMSIMGVHGVQLTRPNSISGRFNAALENKILLFADEAVFNNRKASNILKGMVSEKSVETERKGYESTLQRNYVRLIMAADDDHVVKISGFERRYLILQLSEKYLQDLEYFKRFNQALENGLASKLLYLLMQQDISQFLPMALPDTEYLTEEKLHDLKPEQQFIYEILLNEGFTREGQWQFRIDKKDLDARFKEWLENNRIKFYGNSSIKIGHVMKAIGARTIKNCMTRMYELKNVEYCRTAFEKAILNGSKVDWT